MSRRMSRPGTVRNMDRPSIAEYDGWNPEP
jgi:hypothetical protein